jgi:hypothetical protein
MNVWIRNARLEHTLHFCAGDSSNHSEMVHSIVANLSDEQLIAMDAENHKNRVRELNTRRKDTTLVKVLKQ